MNVNSFPHRSQNQITALFEAGVFTIDISGATTFGELATRLTDLGDQHHDTLTAIRVRKTSRSSTLSRAVGLGAARVAARVQDGVRNRTNGNGAIVAVYS